MLRHALFAGVFALAAPAAAQNMQEPSASPPPAAAPQPTAADVGRLVQAEFPARDSDRNGSLNQAEFSAWLGELLARAPGQASPPSAADLEARTAAAFTRADSDRNRAISPDEMTALLSRTG